MNMWITEKTFVFAWLFVFLVVATIADAGVSSVALSSPATDDITAGSWQKVADADWSSRAWHCSVVLPDNSIAMMGGMDSSFARRDDTWLGTENGSRWMIVNAHGGWTPRYGQSCAALPDGNILLMGGYDSLSLKNDVWQSSDSGVTWTLINDSPGWVARWQFCSEVMPDGNVVLMGGGTDEGRTNLNDIWMSADEGRTWTQVNQHAGWSGRRGFGSAVLQDGTIVVFGGYERAGIGGVMNDTWISKDEGISWMRTGTGAWPARYDFSSARLFDGSILLMGGADGKMRMNDMWRSMDAGATWNPVNTGSVWPARYGQNSVALQDNSVVMTGGTVYGSDGGDMHDVWRFVPAEYPKGAPPDVTTIATQYNAGPDVNSLTLTGSELSLPTGDFVVTPLCPAGSPFGPDTYPQDTPRSDPMVTTCVWDGTGRVFISGDTSSVTGVAADDGYTVTIQPSGTTFDAPIHSGVRHPVLELTGGMRPGPNTITIVARNWNGLSMSYGIIMNPPIRQIPAIVQVTDLSPSAPGVPASGFNPDAIQVIKEISPFSVKEGTEMTISITVFNRGNTTVHDVEIDDPTLPEFPVTSGETRFAVPVVEPNDSRTLTYTVRAGEPGSFRFNRTRVMYAREDGNYRMAYSGYGKVTVLASLLAQTHQEGSRNGIEDFLAWISGFGRT